MKKNTLKRLLTTINKRMEERLLRANSMFNNSTRARIRILMQNEHNLNNYLELESLATSHAIETKQPVCRNFSNVHVVSRDIWLLIYRCLEAIENAIPPQLYFTNKDTDNFVDYYIVKETGSMGIKLSNKDNDYITPHLYVPAELLKTIHSVH